MSYLALRVEIVSRGLRAKLLQYRVWGGRGELGRYSAPAKMFFHYLPLMWAQEGRGILDRGKFGLSSPPPSIL
jgi:hypothetical protein